MLQQRERIVGQAEHARYVFRSDLKRCGAQHHSGFTELFVNNAVMQTARRTGSSVAIGRDHKITACCQRGDDAILRWCTGVGLEHHVVDYFALIVETEKFRRLQQQWARVGLTIT